MLEVVPKPARPRPSKVRQVLLWALAVFGFLLVALSIVFVIIANRFEPYARQWLVSAMEKRYEGEVEIGAFHARFYPLPQATVENIVLRFHRRTDIAPLAKIKRMTLQAGLWGIFEKPVRIHKITIENLEVSIPPKQQREGRSPVPVGSNVHANFVLEEVNADGMILHIIPADPAKEPRDFEFERLTLNSAAIDRPMTYRATLTNWKPPGLIQATGHFGPWDAPEPGGTPLDGKYTYRDADLSVFKGIAGTLSSDGEYHGQLHRIECNGTTDTPNFSVSVGKPVDLKTQFHAIVDGMNGDTMLDPVTAHFLHSTVIARGLVAGVPPRKGKKITLDVTVDQGRVEDFLHLVVNSPKPMMVGPVAFGTSFQLLPGPREVIDHVDLKGHFTIPSARFTDLKVQDILGNISKHARGNPKAETDDHLASQFSGDFTLKNADVTFSRLTFAIPGARILLAGTYAVHGGEIDFEGKARTEAKLSQMTTGIKSVLLKAVDPFFSKGGAGAVVPIRITGTRAEPHFGLNFHKPKP